MSRLHAFLQYFRIEDDDGSLSLTSVAFAVAIYCLLSGKQIDLTALGGFAVAVAAHRHREVTDAK
jgi:hypothetical protein